MINGLQDVDRIVDLIVLHKLDMEQNIFVNAAEKSLMDRWLRSLGSGSTDRQFLNGTDLTVDRFCYKGVWFNLIVY